MDSDRSGRLDSHVFAKALKEVRIGAREEDVARLFKMFDINHDGTIAYKEFMKIVLGEMNEARVQAVDTAFRKLDRDGDGLADLDAIKDQYNASVHPDVVAKRKSEGEVMEEFLDTFEQYYNTVVSHYPIYA